MPVAPPPLFIPQIHLLEERGKTEVASATVERDHLGFVPGVQHSFQCVIPATMIVRWEDGLGVATQKLAPGPDPKALRHNLVDQTESGESAGEQRYQPAAGTKIRA